MFQDKIVLSIGFVIFSFLFLYFFPQNTGIVDETAYLSTAYTFQHGKVYYDQAGVPSAPASVAVDSHLVSRYAPGNSLLLLPFTAIHWKWSFARSFFLIAIGYVMLILILSHFHLPRFYALLFLFHPAFTLYGRTIMSDLPATVCCLIGLFFLVKEKHFLAGLVFGFGIAIRYPVALIILGLLIVLLFNKSFKNLLLLLVGSFVATIPLFLYHLYYFKIITGPTSENMIGFSVTNFPVMIFRFVIFLNILYPALLILPFATRLRQRYIFIAPAVLFVVFFSLQYFLDTGTTIFENIIRGQRYMLPIIPFLLIPYAEVLSRINFVGRIVKYFLIPLVVVNAGIHYKHSQFLKQQTYYQHKLYEYAQNADILICNKDIYELINPYIKPLKWLPFESEEKLLPVDIEQTAEKIFFACLARNRNTRVLFHELLEKYPPKKNIYSEIQPYFFSIWQVEPEST